MPVVPSLLRQLTALARVVADAAASSATTPTRQRRASRRAPGPTPSPTRTPSPAPAPAPTARYAPRADGDADPGEVVWAWVPYEEDPTQGKDRPVLVLDRSGEQLTALMLTSKDHDRDAAEQARARRHWMDVGTGPWDGQRRPSEVRLDRVLRLRVDAVRREGAALDRDLFEQVAAAAAGLRRRG